MGILKAILAVLLCHSLTLTAAEPERENMNDEPDENSLESTADANPLLCNSTGEYIQTLKFFRKTKEIIIKENTARKIAERVSRGCDGAAERFERVLLLLKNVGLSDLRALEMSLDFAGRSPDIQKNFTDIFTQSFLSEFFDYDYKFAAGLAYELSRDYTGDPNQVRKDFIELVRFCKDEKNLDLPARICAEYMIKMAKLSQYYPHGIRRFFHPLYKELRSKPEFGMDVKAALSVSYTILKNGPRAPQNFKSAYEFAKKKEGLDSDQRTALAFALEMAERSFVGENPPLSSNTPLETKPEIRTLGNAINK